MADYVKIAGKTVVDANTDFFGRNLTLTLGGLVNVGNNNTFSSAGLVSNYAYVKSLDANNMTVSTGLLVGNSTVNLYMSPTGISTIGSLTVAATQINGTLNVSGTTYLQTLQVQGVYSTGEYISTPGDAVLTLETTGPATTKYRRKQIYSTINDGYGGDGWLFRAVRPSDNAIRDVVFNSTGTVWMTGNFDPNLKYDKTGGAINGGIQTQAAISAGGVNGGTAGYVNLNQGDAAHSGYIEFWNPTSTAGGTREGYIGYSPNNGVIALQSDRPGGYFNFTGTLPRIGGQTIWYAGNFDPNGKMDKVGGTFTGNVGFNTNLFIPSASGGSVGFQAGTGDGGTLATYNHKLNIWWGLGLGDYSGAVRGVYDSRTGTWNTLGVPQVNGSPVWYPGNFNPATKATVGVNSAVTFGDITANRGDISGVIYFGNTGSRYLYCDVNGTYNLVNGALNVGGTVNAPAFVTTGEITVGSGQQSSRIYMTDTNEGTRSIHNNSGWIGFLNSAGGWGFRMGDDGAIWTSQFGDLNTRIYAVANGARDEANSNTLNNYLHKNNGTQQVTSPVSFNAAYLDIVRGGVLRARWIVDGGGTTILQNGDNGDNFFYVTTGGAVWTKQFGDLNNRIYDVANGAAGARVAKTGDQMTGDLLINKAYPALRLLYGGVYDWLVRTGNNAELNFVNNGDGGTKHAFRPDGSYWNAQLGDMNDRIESRASAWAATRQANLGFTPARQGYNGNVITLGWTGGGINMNVDNGGWDGGRILCTTQNGGLIDDVRWAYVGDHEANEYTALDGYHEPYGGAAVTGFKTNQLQTQVNGSIYAYLYAFRLRVLQKRDTYGNWYNAYYV
jgi:hypothetical protein